MWFIEEQQTLERLPLEAFTIFIADNKTLKLPTDMVEKPRETGNSIRRATLIFDVQNELLPGV